MRILRNIALLVSLVVMLVGCSSVPANYVTIELVEKVTCTYDASTFDVDYIIHPAYDGTPSAYGRYATAEDSWVESVDCTDEGVLRITVAANDGVARTTTVTLHGSNFKPATLTISQMAAPSAEVDRTLIFHFFGTSLGTYFKTNIKDATQAIKEGALCDNNRVVCILQINSTSGSIFELCYNPSDGEVVQRHIDNFTLNSSLVSPDEIGSLIRKAADSAPAKSYALVLAGHGTGWIPRDTSRGGASTLGITYDSWIPAAGAEVTRNFGESNIKLNITELTDGISRSGLSLEFILFDACFMSNIEAVYDLRDAAKYIIASPCEIMGRGFPYHRTLHHLFGENYDIEKAAESYYLFYRDEYVGGARCGSVALYDCAEVESLAEATRAVMATATDDYDRASLQTYEGKTTHEFYDFGEFVNIVATDEAALAMFNEQLERTVIAKFTLPTFYSAYGNYGTYDINEEVYSGVTTSAPSKAYPEAWTETNWYNAVIE